MIPLDLIPGSYSSIEEVEQDYKAKRMPPLPHGALMRSGDYAYLEHRGYFY